MARQRTVFSKTCKYALQAVLYIAQNGKNGNYVHVKDIARVKKLPYDYMQKVVRQLVTAGILKSSTGCEGGVLLKKKSGRLTLLDVVDAIDGLEIKDRCLFGDGCMTGGLKRRRRTRPCPVHDRFAPARMELMKVLGERIDRII